MVWSVFACLMVAAIAMIYLGSRKEDGVAGPNADVAVYKAQLREVDRDAARGILSAEDAERTKLEVSRKLLAADAAGRQAARPSGHLAQRVLWVGGGLSVVAITVGTYLWIGAPGYPDLPLTSRLAMIEEARAARPDQATAEAQVPPRTPAEVPEEIDALVTQLRSILAERPDDLRGHRLLARNEAALGNLVAAREAQARVLALAPEEAQADERATLGELMVLAAGGYVSPEAEAEFLQVLETQPGNGTARYYLGLMYAQGGRPDIALPLWKRLIAESTPDAPWLPAIYAQIEEVSVLAGDPTPLDALPQPRGPSAADVEAAGALSLEERMDMIRGMVEGLSARLASEGGTVEDWGRLITSLGVLGDLNGADRVYQEGRTVFAGNPGALDILNAAADRAGLVPE